MSTGGNEYDDDEVFNMARAKITNLKLKTQVHEVEVGIKEIHEENYQEALRQREEVHNMHSRAAEDLDKFDVHMDQVVVNCHYTTTEMHKLLPSLMPAAEVQQLEGFAAVDVPATTKLLQDLLVNKIDPRVRVEVIQQLRRIVAIHTQEDLVDTILPLHDVAFSDLLLHDHIWEQLGLTDLDVKKIQQTIEEYDIKRQEALEKDEINLSEQLHDEMIRSLADFIKMLQDRIKVVEGQSSRPELLHKLDMLKQGSAMTIEKFKNQQLKLKERLGGDLDLLEAMDMTMRADHGKKCSDFQAFKSKNTNDIEVCEGEQVNVWDEITELYERLKSLGQERYDLIAERMEATETEAKRKALYEKQCLVHGNHYKVLIGLRGKADMALDVLNIVDEYVNKGIQSITDRSEKIEADLAALLLDERKNYLSVFRRYYLTCGELKYKKEKRQAVIDRQIRHCAAQIEFAKETLDPDTKKYQQEQAEVLALRDTCEKKIEILANRMEVATDIFEPTAIALNNAGVSFLHPAIELEEINVSRRAGHNQVVKRYVSEDQEEVDLEDEDVNSVAQEVQKVKSMAPGSLSSMTKMQPTKSLKGSPRRPKSPHKGGTHRSNLLLRRTRTDGASPDTSF